MTSSGVKEVASLLSLINSATQAALSAYAAYGVDVPSFYAFETHPLDVAEDTLALKTAIRTLEGACHQLCATLAPPSYTVYKVWICHFVFCVCLYPVLMHSMHIRGQPTILVTVFLL
jgi:hypothetical protein